MKKIRLYDEFGEQFDQGLVPATEEEQKLCEEKLKSIGALPEGFVKTDKDIRGSKACQTRRKAVGAKNQDGKRKTYASNRQTLRHADSIAKHNVGLHRSHCALCIRRIVFA